MRIGFIGIGNMGEPMARNLLLAGHDVAVYNRTRQRAEALGREGARTAASPAEAAADADVLITMLADDQALRGTVLEGGRPAIDALRRGAIHMSSSTISLEMSKELERRHGERGQGYIAPPVIGRADAAAERRLWVIAAGPPDQIAHCRPVMEALGRGVTVVGEEPWKANVVKIGVNFVLASMVEALGESYALVEKHGVDPHLFLAVLNGGAFQSPVFENYGTRIADHRYQPAGFSLLLGLKDTQLALAAAESAAAPLPFAGVLRDRFLQALAYGQGDLDWAAIAEIARINANLIPSPGAGG
jgi:3-hydroxyisobutyrate dehydrogenase-like beta-hydroxyacid dehydrogenase